MDNGTVEVTPQLDTASKPKLEVQPVRPEMFIRTAEVPAQLDTAAFSPLRLNSPSTLLGLSLATLIGLPSAATVTLPGTVITSTDMFWSELFKILCFLDRLVEI